MKGVAREENNVTVVTEATAETARVSLRERPRLGQPRTPSKLVGDAITYALLILGGIVILVPFFWMISTSLKTPDQLFTYPVQWIPNPAVPENYISVWTTLEGMAKQLTFVRIMGNSLFITILAMVGEIASASLVAYGFARFEFRGRDLLFFIMLATTMLPGILTQVPQFVFWRVFGLIGTFDPLTICALFAWGPLYVFLMRQFFLTIPVEIEEAAILDGANTMQIFYYVMLPLIKPIVLAIAVLSFQGNWNNFGAPLIYLTGQFDKYPLVLAMQYFQGSLSKEAPKWHLMMAMSIILALPILLLFFRAQKYFIEGITVGAVKG